MLPRMPAPTGVMSTIGTDQSPPLDQHVFPGVKGLQRQIEMKSRWHGDDDRVNGRVVDRVGVARVAYAPAVLGTEGVGLIAVAARVTAGDLGSEPAKVATVYPSDETAAEKSDVE